MLSVGTPLVLEILVNSEPFFWFSCIIFETQRLKFGLFRSSLKLLNYRPLSTPYLVLNNCCIKCLEN